MRTKCKLALDITLTLDCETFKFYINWSFAIQCQIDFMVTTSPNKKNKKIVATRSSLTVQCQNDHVAIKYPPKKTLVATKLSLVIQHLNDLMAT